MVKISPKYLDFGGHQIIFWVDTTRKYGPSESKNNAQITFEQLQNNFQKVQKTTFLAHKIVKMTLSEGLNNFEKSQNLTKKYAPPPPTTTTTHHYHHPPTLPPRTQNCMKIYVFV